MPTSQPATKPAEAPNITRAKRTAAQTDISILSTALDMFEVDTGRYPTTAEGLTALVERPASIEVWKGRYFKLPPGRQVLDDPWGRPYVYRCPGQHNQKGFDLFSLGLDGQEGTADDMTNWVSPTTLRRGGRQSAD